MLIVGATSTLAGQGFHGGLRGSVKNAAGVIPAADVTITNEQTNITRSAVSNARGEYVFAAVEPGTYTVRAAFKGGRSTDRPGIRIGTQQFLVLDLTLGEVASFAENITVTGQAPLIETANASQGALLDNAALQALPLSGRAVFLAAAVVPTVVWSGDPAFTRPQDQSNASLFSMGGGTRRGNNYTLDGVPITDLLNRPVAHPTIEGLEDLKVQVHTYDAEMGRTGGGVFNATMRSGTNSYHGTTFFQTRPVWSQVNNYFAQKAFEVGGDPRNAKPDSAYYMAGGGFGGPIVKNRTFFFFSGEAYHDLSTFFVSVFLPTAAERAGDFSGLTNSNGERVTIYDPLTHVAFPGNIIPPSRINPVAAAITRYLPLPQGDRANGSPNYSVAAPVDNYFQQEYALKAEHKFSDHVSLTGFYLYNRTNEPPGAYFEPGQTGANRFADPGDGVLARRPQIVGINNTWIPSGNSTLSLRFGWTRFVDSFASTASFDPATLGFSPTFLREVAQTGGPKFPVGTLSGATSNNAQSFGAGNPTPRTYNSWGANGSYSMSIGTHTIKMGADYRQVGVSNLSPGCVSGCFQFDKEFTSSTGLNNSSTTEGSSYASFLLGYPTGASARQSTMTLTTPLDLSTNYYGGYLQDDWRITSKLTLNYGLRVEHESGMRELNNNFTVGFDRTSPNALSGVIIPASVDPTGGTPARAVVGGLMYAGVNGNNTYQGNPPAAKWSPRVGGVYSIDEKTVLRGGYGLYWAPWNYPQPNTQISNYGQVGFTHNTVSPQTAGIPTVTLDNPFPNGLVSPLGNTLGLVSGAGTTISYVDQYRTAPRVQQYSVDLQRELPYAMTMMVGYIGARGDHLPLGGTLDTVVNINQLDPKYLALGSALNQAVANPFFGIAAAGPLSEPSTLTRAQLLRPFPQFLNIQDRQVSEGVNRYNAMVFEWTKRLSQAGLGGRLSYTYSVLKDNQVGEANVGAPLNHYNYIASMPACTTTNFAACFNPMADYGPGILDVPHRMVMAPVWELPFGEGRRWGNNGIANLLAGGWTTAAVFTLQSGFPIGVTQNDNTGLLGGGQRPNVATGVNLRTSGTREDRLASADHPTATWLNPAAYTPAAPNTFGNAPRLQTDVRTSGVINTAMSFGKNFELSGGKTAQVKIEIFNLLNRVAPGGIVVAAGNATFGQITTQSGFMRMTQFMFRFTF